jgi:DNA-binding GntR family transcriptional regulator
MTTDPAGTSATDRVHRWVKDAIIEGGYAGGDLISEGQVSAALGLSRTPVREAFLRLSAEGLLKLFPKRGALVVPVTPEEVADLIEARTVVEGWAASRAASGAEAGLVGRLRAHLDEQRRAVAADDLRAFNHADSRFHHDIVAAGGNAMFVQFHAGLRDRQLRMNTEAIVGDAERIGRILTEHEAIVDAIERGDADGVRALSDAHVRATQDALVRGRQRDF